MIMNYFFHEIFIVIVNHAKFIFIMNHVKKLAITIYKEVLNIETI